MERRHKDRGRSSLFNCRAFCEFDNNLEVTKKMRVARDVVSALEKRREFTS